MDSAITTLSGAGATCATPKVATASVMLWATVNAVTVFTSIQRWRTISSSPSTNSR